MADCSKCKNADRCEAWDIDKVRRTGECEVYKPTTNADKIRSMSDEELSEWLTKITDDAQLDAKTKCNYQWDEWLKEEAK